MCIDNLMISIDIQAAFLTAALMPYSENYAKENDYNGFVEVACHLFSDISSTLDTITQL